MDTPSTNPPAGLDWKLASRTADDLSTDAGRHATDDVWRCVQRGLVYPSPYAIFVTFFRRARPAAAMTKLRLGRVLAEARHEIHEKFRKAHTTAVLGVDFGLWREMSIALTERRCQRAGGCNLGTPQIRPRAPHSRSCVRPSSHARLVRSWTQSPGAKVHG